MLKLVWRPQALDDLETIIGYIAERNANAADQLLDAIDVWAERIVLHPAMYRPGRVPGTREAWSIPII